MRLQYSNVRDGYAEGENLMKPYITRNKIIWLAGIVLALSGCAGPTAYHRGDLFGGYSDRDEGAGAYEVRFEAQSRSLDFAKACVYYRAAEVTYEKGFRYFSVTKIDDPPPVSSSARGTASEVQIAIIHIQCYLERPYFTCYDAFQCLDQVKMPGTQIFYTVAQRQVDKAVGKIKP